MALGYSYAAKYLAKPALQLECPDTSVLELLPSSPDPNFGEMPELEGDSGSDFDFDDMPELVGNSSSDVDDMPDLGTLALVPLYCDG